MKVIVKDRVQKRLVTNGNVNHDGEFMGRVGGKYDFIMMVGDGTVYGFVGREIIFSPVGNIGKPIGFQWEPVKGKDVDFNWLPLDGEYDYDGYEYDADEDEWIPFEDMIDIHGDGQEDDEDSFA